MTSESGLIFISIAAYRDPQIIPTIEDCLAKVVDASHLRFGICWQHAQDDPNDPIPSIYLRDPRFRILDVDYRASQGACWARAQIMKLWQGEPWFLQIDSHCRFAPYWDQRLIHMAAQTARPRPILSTYATAFTPGPEETLEDHPLQMAFQGFSPDGIPFMKPVAIPHWQTLTTPLRARFLAAGFLFAPGTFVQDVPYDPDLYFLGEEIAMTLRAFTSGYDLFHPHQTLLWHDYGRREGVRHWDDHTPTTPTATAWGDRDLISKQRVRTLLQGRTLAGFSLGATRTLADYQLFAGISFRTRKVQDYTLRAGQPPNPPVPPDWADQVFTWLVRIPLPLAALHPAHLTDIAFCYIGILDEYGIELYRRDLTAAEVAAIPNQNPAHTLVCELQSGSIPASSRIWPCSTSAGWLEKLDAPLQQDDFTIVLEDQPSKKEEEPR